MAKKKESGSQSGGVNFGGGGNVTISGDVVGRDKIMGDRVGHDKITTTTSGMSAEDIAKAFSAIYDKIKQKPAEDREELKDAVDTIKAAAEQEAAGEAPNEKEVKQASQAIVATSPDLIDDVLDVATATLANPAAGVAMIVRKVLEKAKQTRAGGA